MKYILALISAFAVILAVILLFFEYYLKMITAFYIPAYPAGDYSMALYIPLSNYLHLYFHYKGF